MVLLIIAKLCLNCYTNRGEKITQENNALAYEEVQGKKNQSIINSLYQTTTPVDHYWLESTVGTEVFQMKYKFWGFLTCVSSLRDLWHFLWKRILSTSAPHTGVCAVPSSAPPPVHWVVCSPLLGQLSSICYSTATQLLSFWLSVIRVNCAAPAGQADRKDSVYRTHSYCT